MSGPDAGAAPARTTRLLNGRMLALLTSALLSMTGFYLLLSVVPLYANTVGDSSDAAGLATGTMMASTVLTELATPFLVSRFGYRMVMAAGALLLGVPALLFTFTADLPVILAVCLARGAGLAIVVVACTALVAELAPPGRRGETLGLYGFAVSVPAIAALPAGVWLHDTAGFDFVFVLASATSLAALVAIPMLPARHPDAPKADGLTSVLRVPSIRRQAVVFGSTTLAAGVFVTFLPIAATGTASKLVAVALLAQTCMTAVFRWGAGRLGDVHGASRLLIPAMLAAAVGAAFVVATGNPIMVIAGMGLFGVGYGVAQNVTLQLMLDRVSDRDFGKVSAVWNIAFDGGMGVGAVGFGYLTLVTGYPWGFAVVAVLLAAAIIPAVHDRRPSVEAAAPAGELLASTASAPPAGDCR